MSTIDYIDFDDLGIVELRCMQCNTTIAKRKEKYVDHPNSSEIKVLTYKLQKWTNYRQTRFDLNDGTYCEPLICEDCLNHGVFDEDMIIDKIKKGWKKELIQNKRSEKEIKKHEKRVEKLKIKKKDKKK